MFSRHGVFNAAHFHPAASGDGFQNRQVFFSGAVRGVCSAKLHGFAAADRGGARIGHFNHKAAMGTAVNIKNVVLHKKYLLFLMQKFFFRRKNSLLCILHFINISGHEGFFKYKEQKKELY